MQTQVRTNVKLQGLSNALCITCSWYTTEEEQIWHTLYINISKGSYYGTGNIPPCVMYPGQMSWEDRERNIRKNINWVDLKTNVNTKIQQASKERKYVRDNMMSCACIEFAIVGCIRTNACFSCSYLSHSFLTHTHTHTRAYTYTD